MQLLVSEVPQLAGWDATLRLGLAAGLGAAVGFERELRDREAGIRTHLLVSLGSALFTIVSAYGFHEFLAGGGNITRIDPTRIAAQIVTGIGFLGAGAIIRDGLSIRGLRPRRPCGWWRRSGWRAAPATTGRRSRSRR